MENEDIKKDDLIKKNLKNTDYDGIVKQIINNMQSDKIIQFLGNLFGKNYTSESILTKLNPETQNADNEKKISDLYLKVDNDFFNIEIQSTDDKTMAMRIFEYGVRGAMAHGKTYSDHFSKLTLDIPEPVVIYLRKTGKTPDKFTIELNIPGQKKPVSYEAKVKFVNDYSIKDMIEQKLYPMIPFYPMRYEDIVNTIHDLQIEDAINTDIINAVHSLHTLITDGKIEPGDLSYIINAMSEVYKNMMLRGKNVSEEKVGATMEAMSKETVTIFDVYAARAEWRAEGLAEGIEKGKAEGIVEGIKKERAETARKLWEVAQTMAENGVSIDVIKKCCNLTEQGVQELSSQCKDLSAKQPNEENDNDGLAKSRIR